MLTVGLPGLTSIDDSSLATGNGDSTNSIQSLSADGRYQVFTSDADNLVAGVIDNNGVNDVFLRDLHTGQSTLISRAVSGMSGNGVSDQPSISSDGNHVAFRSFATDLEGVDGNDHADIFIWTRTTESLSLVSVNDTNDNGGNADSMTPSISGDGSIVAFASKADNLVAGLADVNGGETDVFLHQVDTGINKLISKEFSQTATGNAASIEPTVSEDGSTVVYSSRASNLVAGVVDSNSTDDIFAYDVASGVNEVLSLELSGNVSGNEESKIENRQALSEDGRYHVFSSLANNLDAAAYDDNGDYDVFLFDQQTGLTTLISVTDEGRSGNGASNQPVISADGNYVAFRSAATDLGSADTNPNFDIYIWERSTGNISLASPNSSGDNGGNGASFDPSISGDGSVVAFASQATNLISDINDANGTGADIFVRSTTTGATRLVTSSIDSTATGDGASSLPMVSRDGSTVVFQSQASNLVSDVIDANSGNDIFAYDVASETNQALSISATGNLSGNDYSAVEIRETISDDGRFQVFTSRASNLDADSVDTNGLEDVYLFDALNNKRTLISAGPLGFSGDGRSDQPVISADGRFVAFRSTATDLVPIDSNDHADIFLWDRITGSITRLSQNHSGTDGGNGDSSEPTISGDSSIVGFVSSATDLVGGIDDANGSESDVFVRQVTSGVTVAVSTHHDRHSTADASSFSPRLSEDGGSVVFESLASDLVAGVVDGNAVVDVFVFDVANSVVEALNLERQGNLSGNGESNFDTRQTISDDGRYQVFTSEAYNLDADAHDGNGLEDVYLFDAQTGLNTLVSATPNGRAGNGSSSSPVISADGNFVAFESRAADLEDLDDGGGVDVFVWERATGVISLVSINATGDAAGGSSSYWPSINHDGSRIAFLSSARDLIAGPAPVSGNIFMRDRSLSATSKVGISSDGTFAAFANTPPIISKDGSTIVFESTNGSLVSDVLDTNNISDVFAYDVATATTEVLSLELDSNAGGNRASDTGSRQSSSDDGRFHVFSSAATNLVSSPVSTTSHIYLFDAVTGVKTLISQSQAGEAGNGFSADPVISADGNFVAFLSVATNLLPDPVSGVRNIFRWERSTGNLTLVSADVSNGGGGNESSFSPSISGDGSIVAFQSAATNLVTDFVDSNGSDADIFVRNMLSATTTLVSSDATNGATGDDHSFDPIVSEDGSTVVFTSRSSNLVPGLVDVNNSDDVFAFDVATGEKEAIGLEVSGNVSGNHQSSVNSRQTSSNDGRYVVFTSKAQNLDPLVADDNRTDDVYLFDTQSGQTTLVSAAPDGTSGNRQSRDPVISSDGNFVAFESQATDLGTIDSHSASDVFLWERATGIITLMSPNATGTGGSDGYSMSPSINGDGSLVAFESNATDLTDLPDANGSQLDVFVRDVRTGETRLVSADSTGTTTGNGSSQDPLISEDGGTIAFASGASNLDAAVADSPGLDLFVRHLFGPHAGTTETLTVVDVAPNVSTGGLAAQSYDLSDNGLVVVFANERDTLLAQDTNNRQDVFVRDIGIGQTELISVNDTNSGSGNNRSGAPRISGDGQFVVFESTATNLSPIDTFTGVDIYMRDRVAETTELISINRNQSNGTNANSSNARISDDGRYVSFSSNAVDLTSDAASSNYSNVFLRDRDTSQTILVSVQANQAVEAEDASFDATVNADGTHVVFASDASDLLGPGFLDINLGHDVYIHDIDEADVTVGTNRLVSRKAFGLETTPLNGTRNPDTSDNGQLIAFEYNAFRKGVVVRDRANEQTELITPTTTSTESTLVFDANPRISGDGNTVVFESSSTKLTSDPVTRSGIYLLDRSAGNTELVSLNSSGTSGGNGTARRPQVSDDGRFVAFESQSSDLIAGGTTSSFHFHVYLRDTLLGQTALININRSGTDAANLGSDEFLLNADGSHVLFESSGTDLIGGGFLDINRFDDDVFLHTVNTANVQAGTNQAVTEKAAGLKVTGSRRVAFSDISDDGQAVVFIGASPEYAGSDTNNTDDIFVRDRSTNQTSLVTKKYSDSARTSYGSDAVGGNYARISGDGGTIVFTSRSPVLVSPQDTNNAADVFAYDRTIEKSTFVSAPPGRGPGNAASGSPTISNDGRYIAFSTAASDIVPGRSGILIRDQVANQVGLLSFGIGGVPQNDLSREPVISGDGTRVVFSSRATNLDGSDFVDLNGFDYDIFSHSVNSSNLSQGSNQIVSGKAAGIMVTEINGSANPDISDDGKRVVYETDAVSVLPNDDGPGSDIYLFERSNATTHLVSVNVSGTGAGNSSSTSPRISGDGTTVVFASRASDLTALAVSNNLEIFARDLSGLTTDLISVNSEGTAGAGALGTASIDENGRFVVFASRAENIAPLAGGTTNIFLRDRDNVTSALISVAPDNLADGNDDSTNAAISGNGMHVSFQSQATNLIGADFVDINGIHVNDIYHREVDASNIDLGTTQIASGAAPGVRFTGNKASSNPHVSNDGQIVAFESDATSLFLGGDTNSNSDVFVYDRSVGSIELISVTNTGRAANRGSERPRVSGDGNSIAFISRANDLTSEFVSTSVFDIFLRDRSAAVTNLISVDQFGGGGNRDSLNPSLSDDGRLIAFESLATDLAADTSCCSSNVYLRDITLEQTARISSTDHSSRSVKSSSSNPYISADGNRVVFQSTATNLLDSTIDINGSASDVFSHAVDQVALSDGTTELVSRKASGLQITGNRQSIHPDVSDAGSVVTFVSLATGLVPSDANLNFDVFARDRSNGVTELISINSSGTGPANRDSGAPVVSGDGNTIVFQSAATDLTADAFIFVQDVFAHDRDTGTTELISVSSDLNFSGNFTFGGDGASSAATVSDDGRHVAFVSEASTLVAPGTVTAGRSNVYYRDRQESRTELVSQNAGGWADGNGDSSAATISDNGVTIAFQSDATDLVTQLDNNGGSDVFFANNNIITVEQIIYFNRDAADEQNSTRDGTGQRSLIRQIEITFSGPVTIPVGPISDDSFVVESILTATAGTRVGLEVISSDLVAGRQVVTLGFTGSELIEDVSQNQPGTRPMLEDGRYRLTIDGNQLGIDADLSDPSVVANNEFFRLYGDTDGDGDVDAVDTFRLRQHWLSGNHAALFDFDDDDHGPTDVDDLLEYLFRFGMTI